jgi:hypothetical protein
MGILGIGGVPYTPVAPVPAPKPAGASDQQATSKTGATSNGSSQLAAQNFASSNSGGKSASGPQKLNASGRGQIVNILV